MTVFEVSGSCYWLKQLLLMSEKRKLLKVHNGKYLDEVGLTLQGKEKYVDR
jgi:hypothetical protein